MTTLTALEHSVLVKLLDGEHPILDQLRKQLPACSVRRRESTGAGFYTYLDVGDAPTVDSVNVRFGDVIADIEGMNHGAGFVLYVEHGSLHMLEGYGYDDPWPSAITFFTLRYATGSDRNWNSIWKVFGK